MLPISTALPMYLLIHLFIWKWTRWIFFIQWIKIFYFLLLILMLVLSRVWPMETSSWLLCPFDMSPLLFEHFLNFWYKKLFQAYLRLSLPRDWNHPFSKDLPGHYFYSWGVPTFWVLFPSAAGYTQGTLPLPLALSLLSSKLQFATLCPQQNPNVPTTMALRTISYLGPEYKSLVFELLRVSSQS